MILVRNLRLMPGENENGLKGKIAKKLKIPPSGIKSFKITKKSLDARKKDDIHYVCAAAVKVKDEEKLLKRASGQDVAEYKKREYIIPAVPENFRRPVIAGFGPAGMFAGLVLAKAGARPLIIERGPDALTRKAAIDAFRAGGPFNENANVQFGEGGAGTFSDGKLNTGINDPRLEWVLEQFYLHGAPEDITRDAKPHIGTDILIDVVQNIRKDIISLGGEVLFNTRLEEINVSDSHLESIRISSPEGVGTIPCTRLILAAGHSARDTFEMLKEKGVPMEQKPFSMGVRIEHLQSGIDISQYGRERGALPAADYSLNVHLPDGNSAYTFCMCPGGEVFAAASEAGGVCTNGMSGSKRDGENANSALLVTLHTEDFPGEDVLSGMYWQREIEQRAFKYAGGNYYAPAQRAGDFLAGIASTGPGNVKPSYRPGVFWGSLDEVLPEKICTVIRQALPELGKKLEGFDSPDAVLTAPETRSSSPVRILRDESLSSPVKGLFPCGEGAGYAGGISSAAVDGMRCAEAVLRYEI